MASHGLARALRCALPRALPPPPLRGAAPCGGPPAPAARGIARA